MGEDMFCKYGLGGTLGEGLGCDQLEGETVAVFVFVEDCEGGFLDEDGEEDGEAGDEEGSGAGEALGWGAGVPCGLHSKRALEAEERLGKTTALCGKFPKSARLKKEWGWV